MTKRTFGVGLIGVEPGRSWAAVAHLPALKALGDDFHVAGIANTSLASAQKAVAAVGLGRAFASVDELIASPDVDVIAVTVKVPHHHAIVSAALKAGKPVYCEWPLGNGLAEAEDLARLARETGVIAVVGTQARMAPVFRHAAALVADGYVGEVLSTTLVGTGFKWGATIEQANAYTLDDASGATMLTIPVGHTLAAIADALGEVASVSAVLDTRRKTARLIETGEDLPATAADEIVVAGTLAGGAPISLHYRGGTPRGAGFLWEITGTGGDLRVTGPGGHSQMMPLKLEGAHGDEASLNEIVVPEALEEGFGLEVWSNVARLYRRMAADIRDGTRTAPTFDDAVRTHRMIAAIERAAREGRSVAVGNP